MAQKQISTVRELVSALGGPRRVAEIAEVGENCVYNWISRGIPGNEHLRFYHIAKRRRLSVAPEVFGYTEKWDPISDPEAVAEVRRILGQEASA